MEVKEKWKRGFSKVQRQLSRKDSNVSLLSSQHSIMEEEDMSGDEVEAYLTKLKSKTGLKNLWSGHKFEGFVDNDHTPDISTDSDDELNMKFSMNADQLRQLTLDSDEDEMRIDYMRGLKHTDENNNELDSSKDSDDEKPINLMNNIHFAELEIGEVQLSDTELEKVSDFLPQVYTLDQADEEKHNSDSDSEYSELNLRNNIHMLDDISEETTTPKINNHRSYGSSPEASSVHTENDEQDEIKEEETYSSNHTTSNISNKTNTKTSTTHHSNSYSLSDFESEKTSPRKSKSSPSRKTKSPRSSHKTRSSTHRSSDRSSSRSSSRSKSQSDTSNNTLRSTETLTSKTSSRKTSKKSTKHSSKHNHHKKSPQKNMSTQTQQQHRSKDDLTDQVLNFSYTWKPPSASNLANHVVDVAAMDILTNYNPAVLAANDMMKFHLDLLKRHITDSQRLYDAYSKEGLNTNYRYTSYENTLKYIKQNGPKVISFEDALKEVKENDQEK